MYDVLCIHSQRCSDCDQVLIILHVINAPCTHEVYFNLCYLSLLYVSGIVLQLCKQAIRKCEKYMKGLTMAMSRTAKPLSENRKKDSDDGVERLEIVEGT